MRFRVAACLACACWCLAPRAQAAPNLADRLELSWEAPAECPSQEQVFAQVEKLVTLDGEVEGSRLVARARVEPREGGGFSLKLELVSGSSRDERELVGDSCQALVDSVAVMLSLQLNPTEKKPAEVAPPSPPPAARPEPAAPPRKPPATEPKPRHRLHIGLGGGIDSAAQPKVALGLRLDIGWAYASFYVGLSYWDWYEQTRELKSGRSGEGSFGWRAGTLNACHETWSSRLVRIGPCLAFEVGRLTATSHDVRVPAQATELWLAALGGAGLSFAQVLYANASLVVPVSRPRFVVEGVGQVHQPRLVGARLSWGLGGRF